MNISMKEYHMAEAEELKVAEVICSDHYRIQRSSSPQIWQKANLEKMEEEILNLNSIDPVKEQNHGCLVIWAEPRRHVRLHHIPI